MAITRLLAEGCETIADFDNKILSALTDDAEIGQGVLIGGGYPTRRVHESLVVLSEAIKIYWWLKERIPEA